MQPAKFRGQLTWLGKLHLHKLEQAQPGQEQHGQQQCGGGNLDRFDWHRRGVFYVVDLEAVVLIVAPAFP